VLAADLFASNANGGNDLRHPVHLFLLCSCHRTCSVMLGSLVAASIAVLFAARNTPHQGIALTSLLRRFLPIFTVETGFPTCATPCVVSSACGHGIRCFF
jgi:hypothetical protein